MFKLVFLSAFLSAVAATSYVTVNTYSDIGCTSLYYGYTYQIGVCITAYTSSLGANSFMYTSTTTGGYTTVTGNYYSDFGCSTFVGSAIQSNADTVSTSCLNTGVYTDVATTTSSFPFTANVQYDTYATTCADSTSDPFYAYSYANTYSWTFACTYYGSFSLAFPYSYTTTANVYDATCLGSDCSGSSGTITITCFAGSETVLMESGETVPLSKVAIGDSILAADAQGNTMFSKVIAIPHGENNDAARFTKLTTANGKDIQLTPEHLIATSPCSHTELSLTAAGEVTTGMCLQSTSGLQEVVSIEKVKGRGLYTIVTEAEMVVINGFVASPFAYNHAVGNAYYNVQRAVNAVSPALLNNKLANAAMDVFGSIATSVAAL